MDPRHFVAHSFLLVGGSGGEGGKETEVKKEPHDKLTSGSVIDLLEQLHFVALVPLFTSRGSNSHVVCGLLIN